MTALFESSKESPQGERERPERVPSAGNSGSLLSGSFSGQRLFEFPPDSGETPEPTGNPPSNFEGDRYELQDDCPRTPETIPGDARGASKEADAAFDAGGPGETPQGQSRNLE